MYGSQIHQLTDMEGIVIPTETINDCLLRGSLITDDPVSLPILRNRLGLGRRADGLPKALAGDFSPEVKGGALCERLGTRRKLMQLLPTNSLA